MSQFMLSVHHDPADDQAMAEMTPEDMQVLFAGVEDLNTALQAEGAWVFACGLEPIEASTVVDHTGDTPVVTDGPFSESKEYLGGFWVIEATDLDAALAWAGRASRACQGKVEVRPMQGE